MNAFLIRVYILLSALFITFSGISQKLTVNLTNGDSKFYFDGKYIGVGTKVVLDQEIDKNILNHQIKVVTPGFVDAYYAITANKQSQFKAEYLFLNDVQLPKKEVSEKFLFFFRTYNLVTAYNNLKIYNAVLKENSEETYAKAEKNGESKLIRSSGFSNSSDIEYNYSFIHTIGINDLLKKQFFFDSTSLSSTYQNSLRLEVKILSLKEYKFDSNANSPEFSRVSMLGLWYIKNFYGELLDSVEVEVVAGDFTKNTYSIVCLDVLPMVLEQSIVKLQQTDLYKKYQNLDLSISESVSIFKLKKPEDKVTKVEDAVRASVIIKCNDKSHGSGFAITNDGYLLTNYHVICSEKQDKPVGFVVLYNGKEYKAEVVRIDKMNDIALLKIDAVFEKAFGLSLEKEYKIYDEVYTIGAPTSIDLGQTMTKGLISNDRMLGGKSTLQLSMGVNFGNSGGPLFDKEGTLHGVIVSKIVGASAEGLAFAVPTFQISKNLNLVIE